MSDSQQDEDNVSVCPQSSVRVSALYAVGHCQFAPPPLTEQFAVLLNLHADVEHLLDGFLKAVEVIVDQSCEGQRGDSRVWQTETEGCLFHQIKT